MIDFLAENPLFLLFLVVAIGYPFGRIKIAGSSFGVATILFSGLAIGAIDPSLKLPAIIYELGLVVFVYTVGLSSGRGFAQSLRHQGVRNTVWSVSLLSAAAALVAGLSRALNFSGPESAGLYAGSLTNTPALAGVLDYLGDRFSGPTADAVLAEPVIAYSIAYPMGVVGAIAAIAIAQRLWKIDYRQEALRGGEYGHLAPATPLINLTYRVTNPDLANEPIGALTQRFGELVVFGRLVRGNDVTLVTADSTLLPGDLVSLIGEADVLDRIGAFIGEVTEDHPEMDRSELDYRRIFVSNPAVTGQRLRDLNLPRDFGAIVTRIRRGDIEFLPTGETILEPGDRVRIVTTRQRMAAITEYLGDSYRALSEIDILTFSAGIAAGLALGAIPIPLPGGIEIKLGIAGGPLLVALVLGALERTGRLNWTLSYSANLTLRQFGLILFLAGIGTRAGYAFRDMVGSSHGLLLLGAGAVVTLLTTIAALWTARVVLKTPMSVATGMVAGLQTQPAVLSYALEQSGDELPNAGYAMVFPIATIAKIIIVQILIASLL